MNEIRRQKTDTDELKALDKFILIKKMERFQTKHFL